MHLAHLGFSQQVNLLSLPCPPCPGREARPGTGRGQVQLVPQPGVGSHRPGAAWRRLAAAHSTEWRCPGPAARWSCAQPADRAAWTSWRTQRVKWRFGCRRVVCRLGAHAMNNQRSLGASLGRPSACQERHRARPEHLPEPPATPECCGCPQSLTRCQTAPAPPPARRAAQRR